MSSAVANLFESHGTVIPTSGNQPLPMIDPRAAWLVKQGHVDVFAVTIVHEHQEVTGESGGSRGAGPPEVHRKHLMRIERGELLFGFSAPGAHHENVILVGFGSADAEVIRLPVSCMAEGAAGDLAFAKQIAPLVDQWVDRVCALCVHDQVPSGAVNLRPAMKQPKPAGARPNGDADSTVSECVLVAGQSAQPQSGVLWLQLIEGKARFLDHDGICTFDRAGCAFPISHDAWLTVPDDVERIRLRCCRAAELVRDAAYWHGLNAFHDAVEAVIDVERLRDRDRDRHRLAAKSEHDRAVVSAAFADLEAILNRPHGVAAALGADSPLVAACRLVGDRLGIPVRAPAARAGRGIAAEHVAPLETIARLSRFAIRRVQLRSGWHREDGGPLLGYLKKSGRPVALLPRTATSYEVHDPCASGDQCVRVVTAAVASEISPTGYAFYRTLPDRPLGLIDLLRFCLHGIRRDVLTVAAVGAVAAVLTMATPVAVGHVFDTVVPGAERAQLVQVMLGLIVAALCVGAFQITRNIALIRIQHRAVPALQAAVWNRLINLPARFFSNYTAGDLATRAMGVDSMNDVVSTSAITSLITSAFSVVSLALLFYYSPLLAVVATGIVLLVLGVILLCGLLSLRYDRAVEESQGKIAGMLFQFMNGISKLRIAAAEQRAFAQWARRFAEQTRLAMRARIISNNLQVFYMMTPVVAYMILFMLMVDRAGAATEGAMTTGRFLAFISAFAILLFGVVQFGSVVVSMMNAVPIYARLKPILEAVPEGGMSGVGSGGGGADPGSLRGRIEVSNVHFRYEKDGPVILDNVSVRAEPGEFVAIAGPSGSGKSTLLRILLGFETPESGSISYDGFDASGLDSHALRRQLGVVLQESALLPGDIFTNIVGSAVDLTLDDAWEAARLAGIESDIREMPMGMHTVISEGAGTLSGGQRQRIMIARALVTKPRIVFFDEATSALDNPTQAIVTESLDRMRATRLVIAHRLSTIVNADRIYVMDQGRIVQSGTYEDLMSRPGMFQELVKRQIA